MNEATQDLDQIGLAQMSPREFASHAIVLGVELASEPHAPCRLKIAEGQQISLDELRSEIRRRLPVLRRSPCTEQETRLVEERLLRGLMSMEIDGDGMCNRVFGGRPLVVTRAELIRTCGRAAVASAAHRAEVVIAAARRQPVHEESMALYGLRAHATHGVAEAS